MIETSFRLELENEKKIQEFIQKNVYETFLLNLLLKTPYFSSKTMIITDQSNSECDFYDPYNGKYYEATLLVNKKIISGLISDPTYLVSDELYNEWKNLLEIFNRRLSSKENKDASIILFNIFPDIFAKFEGAITDIYLFDNADHILNELVENNKKLKNKDIILVSLNWDGSFFYKTLNSNKGDLTFIKEYSEDIFPFSIVNSKARIT